MASYPVQATSVRIVRAAATSATLSGAREPSGSWSASSRPIRVCSPRRLAWRNAGFHAHTALDRLKPPLEIC